MKKIKLEILISTMNRTDLSFLTHLFLGRKLSEFHILIINQTTAENLLHSTESNIRVINSFERGLSKSRNLAIENSMGEIAMIADDDINYLPGFDEIVLKAFKRNRDATALTFKMNCPNNLKQKRYLISEQKISSLRGKPKPSSVELAVRPEILLRNKIKFNEFFGLGAEFPMGEESLFIQDIISMKLAVYFIPETIVNHIKETTGSQIGSEKHIYAISGLKYLEYGKWSKIWLVKFLFDIIRNGAIPLKKTIWAYQIGVSGIKKAKKLNIQKIQSP